MTEIISHTIEGITHRVVFKHENELKEAMFRYPKLSKDNVLNIIKSYVKLELNKQ